MGVAVDALKELIIAGDTAQQPVKQDEPVGGVGGAVSDQSVEKKQEDYDKGNAAEPWSLCKYLFMFSRVGGDVTDEKKKTKEEEAIGHGHCRKGIRGIDHVR